MLYGKKSNTRIPKGSIPSSHLQVPPYVKHNKTVLALRKVFIILTCPNGTQLKTPSFISIYYPIKTSKKLSSIPSIFSSAPEMPFCFSFKDIFPFIWRLGNFNLDESAYKLNLYNDTFTLINNDNQLIKGEKHNLTLYVKVSLIGERMGTEYNFHLNPMSKFYDTSKNVISALHSNIFSNQEIQGKFGGNLPTINTVPLSPRSDEQISSVIDSPIKSINTKIVPKESNLNLFKDFYLTTPSAVSLREQDSHIPSVKTLPGLKVKFQGNKVNSAYLNGKKLKVKQLKISDTSKTSLLSYTITEIPSINLTKNQRFDNNMDNLSLLNVLIEEIREFNSSNLNEYLLEKDLDIFDNGNSNYIISGNIIKSDMHNYKKEYLVQLYLSCYVNRYYKKEIRSFLENYPNSKQFLSLLNKPSLTEVGLDINTEFKRVIQNKGILINQILTSERKAKISFFYFLFTMVNCIDRDPAVVVLILKSMNIPYNSDISFQNFCDYKMWLKTTNIHKMVLGLKEILSNCADMNHMNKQKKGDDALLVNKVRTLFNINGRLEYSMSHNHLTQNNKGKIAKIYLQVISYVGYGKG